jgi:hypothetical protein
MEITTCPTTYHQQTAPATARTRIMTRGFPTGETYETRQGNISTLAAELQLNILFYLVLPPAQRLFHSDGEISNDDLRIVEDIQNKNTLAAAIATEAHAYLQVCEPARACWEANSTILIVRVARALRRQTAPILEAIRREQAQAKFRWVVWSALAQTHDTLKFRTRRYEAMMRYLDLGMRYVIQDARDFYLAYLEMNTPLQHWFT